MTINKWCMEKSEIRKKQWEIGQSLFSSLKTGKVLTGRVGKIIRTCRIKADGRAVAKYLERAENMHTPFKVNRTPGGKNDSHDGCIYRIRLKE